MRFILNLTISTQFMVFHKKYIIHNSSTSETILYIWNFLPTVLLTVSLSEAASHFLAFSESDNSGRVASLLWRSIFDGCPLPECCHNIKNLCLYTAIHIYRIQIEISKELVKWSWSKIACTFKARLTFCDVVFEIIWWRATIGNDGRNCNLNLAND